jgi:hypothetical protein
MTVVILSPSLVIVSPSPVIVRVANDLLFSLRVNSARELLFDV